MSIFNKEKDISRHIIIGGFDYPVLYEMNQNAILEGVEYFVEFNSDWIGKEYLGKKVYDIDYFMEDYDKCIKKPIVLIGSIIYYSEIDFELKNKGLIKDVDYMWAIDYSGDDILMPLWKKYEWTNQQSNKASLVEAESGEATLKRYELVSKMIDYKKNKIVIDFGAATGRMEQFLPTGVKYYPVDYIGYTDKTIICDINTSFPVFNEGESCIVALSFLYYCNDWKLFLKNCSEIASTVIIAHNDFVRMNREFRRTQLTWNSVFFNHDIIIEMQKLGFKLTEAYDFRLKNVIMKFEKI